MACFVACHSAGCCIAAGTGCTARTAGCCRAGRTASCHTAAGRTACFVACQTGLAGCSVAGCYHSDMQASAAPERISNELQHGY